MQDQGTRDSADPLDPDTIAGAVLGSLIYDRPCLQTPHELALKFVNPSHDIRKARVQVEDALSDLAAHGLIHRLDGFVMASQAGIKGHGLDG